MEDKPDIETLIENPFPEDLKKKKTPQVVVTASVKPRDKEIVTWLAGFFDTSKSDIVRTALRHLYANVTAGVYQHPKKNA